MNQQVTYTPGGLIQGGANGSNQQFSDESINWAIASNGMISQQENYTLSDVVYQRGRPPYGRCHATGYLCPISQMVTVDGNMYIPDFAPISRRSM